jgi:inorganic pyrophosphatase
MKELKSLEIAQKFLDKEVEIIIDRPLGAKHPEFGFRYEVNYGYIPGTKMPDGEELDAYCLGWDTPLETARGKVIAIIHRLNDQDDKLVVTAPGRIFDDVSIEKQVMFQEKYFAHVVTGLSG